MEGAFFTKPNYLRLLLRLVFFVAFCVFVVLFCVAVIMFVFVVGLVCFPKVLFKAFQRPLKRLSKDCKGLRPESFQGL